MKINFILLFLFITKIGTFGQVTGSFIDSRDRNAYKSIKIGSQIWMAENLNFGTDSGSWCYDNKPMNCRKFGRLYDWEMATIVCPAGWHLPSDEEWKTLEKSLGMSNDEANSSGNRGENSNIGWKLKSKSDWGNSNVQAIYDNGFNALPGGCYGTNEKAFYFKDSVGMFYTSTSYDNDFAWYRDLHYKHGIVFRGHRSKKLAYSVRCIKNE